ncbi:hypothetical protein AWM75_03395 [Aerococcus urinaehominis]|uniref:Uncharacterized protein n=1 Tax=Aerococcus urinaehominis TaxID=128944 RepID=A0A0X8FKP9_9LACT|nr:DUF3100 domain-containing protein [Aerococcus urinaehominis]AMB99103.1 hypothetical protein AWM75_03395 [Aerococcus urinaehominis]SDM03791.1 Protein of unknown function [Aerococcus urinaehominis]
MSSSLTAGRDWRLHALVFVSSIVAELIGPVRVPLGRFSFTLAPLIWSMILMAVIYIAPKKAVLSEKNVGHAATAMALAGGLLMAKLGVSSGASLNEILAAGLPVALQNLGEGFSSLFSLPLAILVFGMSREAIGMTFGVSREANVTLISEKYGAESAEFRGVMVNYIVGTVFGVVAVSMLVSFLSTLPFISPRSLALASGIGSASMMVGGLGTLIENYPDQAQVLEAYAAASNVVSTVIAIYTSLFIGLPFTEWWYKMLKGGKQND